MENRVQLIEVFSTSIVDAKKYSRWCIFQQMGWSERNFHDSFTFIVRRLFCNDCLELYSYRYRLQNCIHIDSLVLHKQIKPSISPIGEFFAFLFVNALICIKFIHFVRPLMNFQAILRLISIIIRKKELILVFHLTLVGLREVQC